MLASALHLLLRPRRRELTVRGPHRQTYLVRPPTQRLRSRWERLLVGVLAPAPPDWRPAFTIPEDHYALGWP